MIIVTAVDLFVCLTLVHLLHSFDNLLIGCVLNNTTWVQTPVHIQLSRGKSAGFTCTQRSIRWLGRRCTAWQMEMQKENIRCMEDAEELARMAADCLRWEEQRHQKEVSLRQDGELPPLTREEEEWSARGGGNIREVSWIWTAAGTAGTDAGLEEELEKDALGLSRGTDFSIGSERWKIKARCLEPEHLQCRHGQAQGSTSGILRQAASQGGISRSARQKQMLSWNLE
ncbi:hypothetical protein B0H19DRAFT_1066142 [Mycena capillaripes]|nr:hypothetical protein B0H19DRAFT_1066142 [Mycena capillaripes]